MSSIHSRLPHDEGHPLPESLILANAAQQAVEPKRLEPNTPYALLQSDGSVAIEVTEHRKPEPIADHIKASRTFADEASFVEYVKRHHDAGTEVYADLTTSTIIAHLDGPTASSGIANNRDRAGREAHLATLTLTKTPAWLAWVGQDGKLQTQVQFAEHIEDNLQDIIEPAAADMLELAQTFQATSGVEFKSSQRLSTGETNLKYAEKTEATAGRSGDIAIPERFKIAVVPFIGGEISYGVSARFRYRLRSGELLLSYRLDRPEKVLEDAFQDVLTAVKTGLEGTDVPVFHGKR